MKPFLTWTLISISSVHKIIQSQSISHIEMVCKDWTNVSFKKYH